MKSIVTIGGGTGTFVVLSGLKQFADISLSAIVSVADDGGSTGRLRDAYGYLPTGDVRQALVALAEEGSVMRRIFMHRFEKGDLAGHNMGNLLLTGLTDIYGSMPRAIFEAAEVLRVRGAVIPVSLEPAVLCTEFQDGAVTFGEQGMYQDALLHGPVSQLSLKSRTPVSPDAARTLKSADVVIVGPGDLYSSLIANFVVHGMREVLSETTARLVYIANLVTSPEVSSRTISGYLEVVERYVGRRPDTIVVNNGSLPESVLQLYAAENRYPIIDDLKDAPSVLRADLVDRTLISSHAADSVRRSLVRHDSRTLGELLHTLL